MQPDMTLADVLRRAVQLFPDRPATVDSDGVLTYEQLGARVRALAAGLRRQGLEPGDSVAALMQNGHRYLEMYFGVAAAGGILVPLNNRHATAEHKYILDDAGVQLLVTDRESLDMAYQLADSVKAVVAAPDEYEEFLDHDGPELASYEAPAGAVAALFYTGGTTGKSKGVMLSHRNLVANALHTIIGLEYRAEDRYLHAAPMFHLADGAFTYALTWVGGCHIFVPTFEPAAVLNAIERHRVTVTMLVPTMINSLINHPDLGTTDCSSMRLVMHGGAPIATELLSRATEQLGCSFTQAYGMTEAAPNLTFLRHEEKLIGDDRLRSAGQEIIGVEVRVVRPDGTLCNTGEVGEVIARGPNMLMGYWNRPEETAAALRNGWYWSGDMGFYNETRHLFIVDRAKDMIISGGENVYSTEVENAVMAHPAVLECAVFGIPDEHWGERVHVALVLRPHASLTVADLASFCAERIAGYKRPRSMELHDSLPKSGAGKILKRDLRARHWEGKNRSIN